VVTHGQVRSVREQVVEVVVIDEADLDVTAAHGLNRRRVIRIELDVVLLQTA
jgi:hypothetical protein